MSQRTVGIVAELWRYPVKSGPQWSGFVEDSWVGGSLEIGGTVRGEEFQPTVWCVTSTLAQQDLPRDLSILRTTAEHHRGCLGVYATVSKPGLARVADSVFFLSHETSGEIPPRQRNV